MFNGYTQETFEFFMAIRFNNNRPFFQANYDWYQQAVRQPSLELAGLLGGIIEEIDPDLERRPYRALSHINRDVRFAKDKSPYRDYLWINFKHMDGNKGKLPELYFDVNDENSSYGMGFYRPNATLMKRFRKRIEANPAEFESLYAPLAQEFHLMEFPDKKPAIPDTIPELIRPIYSANRFYLTADIKNYDLIKSPALSDYLIGGFSRLKPLYRYICDPD